jgi:hypothetical protein
MEPLNCLPPPPYAPAAENPAHREVPHAMAPQDTGVELMSILGILFSGEERWVSRRYAMTIEERDLIWNQTGTIIMWSTETIGK